MAPDVVQPLLQSARFEVQHWTFEQTPVGRLTRDVVVHPGAVVILPLLPGGELLMIRQLRPAVGVRLLELPAGTLEPGEQPEDCAGRELEEETGYRAARLEAVGTFFTTPGFCTERMHAFIGRDLRRTAPRRDPSEMIETEILDPAEVRRQIVNGRVEDGKTLAVLGMFFLRKD